MAKDYIVKFSSFLTPRHRFHSSALIRKWEFPNNEVQYFSNVQGVKVVGIKSISSSPGDLKTPSDCEITLSTFI